MLSLGNTAQNRLALVGNADKTITEMVFNHFRVARIFLRSDATWEMARHMG